MKTAMNQPFDWKQGLKVSGWIRYQSTVWKGDKTKTNHLVATYMVNSAWS